MDNLILKARDYFIIARMSEIMAKYDVVCSNYFKSLAGINDYILSKKGFFPKDHHERFLMLKENESFLYKITSSLFLTYRRAYTKEITKEEVKTLKEKIKEAFKYAGIEYPADSEVEKYFKK